jgi:hypothetical protein
MGLRWLAFARSLLLFVERALGSPFHCNVFRKFTLVAVSATKHVF